MTATPTNAAKFAAWCAQSDPKPNTLEEALRERSPFSDPEPLTGDPSVADLMAQIRADSSSTNTR